MIKVAKKKKERKRTLTPTNKTYEKQTLLTKTVTNMIIIRSCEALVLHRTFVSRCLILNMMLLINYINCLIEIN